MPVCEADPWRMQYFEGVPCPEDVNVPTEDGDAYIWYPEFKWVYNKLSIAESQGLRCAPHGIDPDHYPVFSKPIYNMRGMGVGSRVLRSDAEYRRALRPGHMWSELLEGDHVSTDVAIVDGEPKWWRHTTGIPIGGGMFDYWVVEKGDRESLVAYFTEWIRNNLAGYTGMINLETIGDGIIECHLRFADQWPDLYGQGWVEAVIKLYADRKWDYRTDRRTGYSVVLFGAHGIQYRHPDPRIISEVKGMSEVTSVQVTFHEDKDPVLHSMPPGGFRLAIVNGWDLDVLKEARDKLALGFWSTQQLTPGRRRKKKNLQAGESA